MGSKALNPKAQPFFLNRFQTPYLPAWPVCEYRIVHQPRSFFCQLNLVQPNPTTKRVPRKSVKSKRNFAPPRSRNPLKKLEDENHVVGAPRVLAWVPKKDLPAGKRCTASYRQMKKDTVRGCDDGGGGGCVIPFPASPDLEISSGPTTIMIKNIPNQFQRCDLLTVLRNHCRDENLQACTEGVTTKSEFDFVYLPMDFKQFWNHKRTANLGYAFVNFTSFTAAKRFYKKFHNEEWRVRSNKKTCEITCAKVQGLEALKKNFESKVFRCHSEEYLPAVVEPPCDGVLQQPKVTSVGTCVGLPFVELLIR